MSILGNAFIGGLCGDDRGSIIEDYGHGSSATATHELGHRSVFRNKPPTIQIILLLPSLGKIHCPKLLAYKMIEPYLG